MIKTETLSTRPQLSSIDNRIFFRNPLLDAKANIKNVETGERFDAFVKDISGSGMGIATSKEFSKDTVFEISLEIPDGFGPLKILGKVIWSRELGLYGFRTGVVILNPRFMSVSRILKLFF
ncbi:MAG TPA: PilZ domain-containing protein [Candidatus Omnitrophota bacterium]|nr:PilZ domain-containing protein [Candidatus Omnitrophota bacterium]